MILLAKDLKAYADGVRHQINRCKALCDAPSTSEADFDRANSLLSWLPRVESYARALAHYMATVENIEAHSPRISCAAQAYLDEAGFGARSDGAG